MYCPRCRYEVMVRVGYRAIEVHRCPTCGGMLLEPAERDALLGAGPTYSRLPDDSDRAPRHCFRCAVDMNAVEDSHGHTLDHCEICGSVFVEGSTEA